MDFRCRNWEASYGHLQKGIMGPFSHFPRNHLLSTYHTPGFVSLAGEVSRAPAELVVEEETTLTMRTLTMVHSM